MVLVHHYGLAVFFFLVAMTCWGSWANTQKLAAKNWRFELFYWDVVIGLLVFSLLAAFTLGSLGNEPGGRTFMQDLAQADARSIAFGMLGGVIWNLGNLLLVAAIAVAGLAVGFPIGGGIAWLGGTILGYMIEISTQGESSSNPYLLFIGMGLAIAAIYLSMVSYKRLAAYQKKASAKGIILSVLAGLFIAPFYTITMYGMDPVFGLSGAGSLTPYTGTVMFALGAFLSTFIFNPFFMARPVEGEPVKMSAYFKGSFKTHWWGILGGSIWMLGMVVSFMSSGEGTTIAYALSNAAPVVAILWGVFIWKEFKGAPKGTNGILAAMFVLFLIALVLITMSNS
ncbi:MAG: GRP family sugar transporter [Bacteroidales bacterium]